MGRVVIVGLRPKPGCSDALKVLVKDHVAILREEGLATDREPVLMEAGDGSLIEVFEWVSSEAIEAAHSNPRILAMWNDYAAVCDFVPVGTIAECNALFSEFTPL